MGDAKPPRLPDGLPDDLRAFFECRTTSATIKDGPFEVSGYKGAVSIKPGATPGTATLGIDVGATLDFPVSIENGALKVDFGWKASFLPEGATQWLDDLNAWFKANGYAWGQPTFDKGTTTLRKVPLAAPATTATPPAPPSGKPAPTPKPTPKPKPTPTQGDVYGTSGTSPMPYGETGVVPPALPKSEVAGQPPSGPLEDVGTGSMNP